jgi:hypothetical protein
MKVLLTVVVSIGACLCLAGSAAADPLVTLAKDCDDPQEYPGIRIIGTGFEAGELVEVTVKLFKDGEKLPTQLEPYIVTLGADAAGQFDAKIYYELADRFDVTVFRRGDEIFTGSIDFDCPWHDPVPLIDLRVVPKHFPVADADSKGGMLKGAYFSVRFSEPVTVTFRIRRRDAPRAGGPPPKHSRTIIRDWTGDGLNNRSVHFLGRLGELRFKPGRYLVSAIARDEAGQRSEKVVKGFRITRR